MNLIIQKSNDGVYSIQLWFAMIDVLIILMYFYRSLSVLGSVYTGVMFVALVFFCRQVIIIKIL